MSHVDNSKNRLSDQIFEFFMETDLRPFDVLSLIHDAWQAYVYEVKKSGGDQLQKLHNARRGS